MQCEEATHESYANYRTLEGGIPNPTFHATDPCIPDFSSLYRCVADHILNTRGEEGKCKREHQYAVEKVENSEKNSNTVAIGDDEYSRNRKMIKNWHNCTWRLFQKPLSELLKITKLTGVCEPAPPPP